MRFDFHCICRSNMQSKIHIPFRAFLILLLALTVSCRGKGAIQVAEFSEQAQFLPPGITVVNWNAQKGRHPQFVKDLKLLLEQEAPDIVFLQEVTPGLFQPEQMGGYFAESWSYPWPGGDTNGVLTLSRIPPVRIQSIPTKYREFGVTAPKVSLVTEYPLSDGQNLLAVNVHLMNFERWTLKKLKHQLKDLKTIMVNHSGPIIMAGDFNTWNQKRLQLVNEMIQDIKLKEVTDFPEGRTTGDTRSEFWNEVLGVEKNLPLDRVFFLNVRPESARVLDFDTSDHKPLLVKLMLQP